MTRRQNINFSSNFINYLVNSFYPVNLAKMTLSGEENDANMTLSQLKNILNKDYNNTAGYIEEILKTGYKINSSIKSTPHLESKQPELIGCTALHLAFMEKCTDGFETLIEAGADYTIKNRDGLTVLHKILEDFYRNGSMHRLDSEFSTPIMSVHSNNLVNPCTSYGLSHFHAACLCNNADLVKSFLESGVLVDDAVKMDAPCFPGFTPLHFAIRSYGYETVQILLEKGANQNLENAEKKTPLLMLTEQKIKLISPLDTSFIVPQTQLDDALDNHEKLMCLLYKQNNNDLISFSAFHLACTMEDSSLLEGILENGVDVNSAIDQDSPWWPGFTGLHFAALCNFDNLMLLLKKGANIEIQNSAGVTAFDVCLDVYIPECIAMILSTVDIWKDIVLSDNQTTLVDLIEAMDNCEQFEAFLENSAERISVIIPVDSLLLPGYTILHLAVQFFVADLAIVNTCLKAGADVKAQSANGSSALHLAFRKGKKKILVDLLLQHHREQLTNLTDNQNLSVLHIACATSGNEDFVKNLLQSGLDVNIAYRGKSIGASLRSGFTPLHVAVVCGNDELVRELLKCGADRYAPDSDGFTPIHWVLAAQNPNKVGGELFAMEEDVRESIVSGLSHLHVASYVEDHQLLEGRRFIKNYEFMKQLLAIPETNVNVTVRYNNKSSPPFLSEFADATPLHLAVQKKNLRMVLQLVPSGADILIRRSNGSIPLYDALNLAEINHHASSFITALKNDDDVRRRVKEDTGLTMLHLACFMTNMEEIERLLKNGEDINVQIHADSPVWPGYTPLHVLVRYDAHPPDLDIILRKLNLEFDYTLKNADGDTATHLAYKYRRKYWLQDGLIMKTHNNYNENPTNDAGFSYFHIACSVTISRVVEGFVNSGVDVNRSIDPFYELSLAGQSPLHLALNPQHFFEEDSYSLKKIVDLLIQNGAKVNAKDALGESPLHKAVKLGKSKFDVLKKVIEAGANVKAFDVFCQNPWYWLLNIGNFSSEQLELFIEKGCRLNGFYPVENDGYVSLVFHHHGSQSEEKRVLFDAMLTHPHAIDTDEDGCTVVHSFVANHMTQLSDKEYAKLVEELVKLSDTECDIDDQDEIGRTALHVAAYYGNHCAIEGLLIAGADVNLLDNDGYSAFDYLDEDILVEESTVIAKQVKKLVFMGLHASQDNRNFAARVFKRFALDEATLRETVRTEFELAKSVEIPVGLYSHSLRNFLTETYSAMTIHALMGDETGKLIKRFFRDFKDERFAELRSILKSQYRKALARSRLIERASDALDRLSRCTVLCARLIAGFLSNDELKFVIEARMNIVD